MILYKIVSMWEQFMMPANHSKRQSTILYIGPAITTTHAAILSYTANTLQPIIQPIQYTIHHGLYNTRRTPLHPETRPYLRASTIFLFHSMGYIITHLLQQSSVLLRLLFATCSRGFLLVDLNRTYQWGCVSRHFLCALKYSAEHGIGYWIMLLR